MEGTGTKFVSNAKIARKHLILVAIHRYFRNYFIKRINKHNLLNTLYHT